MRVSALLLTLVVLLVGCTSTGCAQTQPRAEADTVTVTGQVLVRGNVPFTALVLETDARALYVLTLPDAERSALQAQAPGTFRVTGTLYLDDWNGQSMAHLRVSHWEAVTP